MVKISGKVLKFFLLLCISMPMYSKVELRAFDLNLRPIREIEIGTLFFLKVIVQDSGTIKDIPQILLPDRGKIEFYSRQLSQINTYHIDNFLYLAYISSPGLCEIGPAKVEFAGKSEVSNVFMMQVKALKNKEDKVADKKKDVFLEMTVDKNNVFFGEKINAVLKLYSADDSIQLLDIFPHTFRDQTNFDKSFERVEVDGIIYNCFRFDWHFFANQSGMHVIPQVLADYLLNAKNRNSLFLQFFSSNIKKTTCSEPVIIQVNSLPACNELVQAVGGFVNFRAFAHISHAKQGEGIVYTLELDGEGNFENIESPVLNDVPEGIKVIPSTTIQAHAENNKNKIVRKRFEYILQPLNPGEYVIPPQKITYFNLETKKYNVLKTSSVTVYIAKAEVVSLPEPSKTNAQKVQDVYKEPIAQLDKQGKWYPVKQGACLPHWFFVLLGALPLAMPAYRRLRKKIYSYYYLSEHNIRAKSAVKVAQQKLEKAKIARDITQVYHIFVHLMVDRFKIEPIKLTQGIIETHLCESGFTKEQLAAWQSFFALLYETQFAKNTMTQDQHKKIFQDADIWLALLERQL